MPNFRLVDLQMTIFSLLEFTTGVSKFDKKKDNLHLLNFVPTEIIFYLLLAPVVKYRSL